MEQTREKRQQNSDLESLYMAAINREETGDIKGAEQIYLQLFDLEQSEEKHQWMVLALLSELYERNHMYLKLEKVGKRICQLYPLNYYGYHIWAISLLKRNKAQEAKILLDEISEEMKSLPVCLEDYVRIYIGMEQYDHAESLLKVLSVEFGNLTAMISLGFLMLSREEYRKAIELSDFILNYVEKEDEIPIFYSNLIRSLAKISEDSKNNRPIDDTIDAMLNYIEENQLNAEDIVGILKQLKRGDVPVIDGGDLRD